MRKIRTVIILIVSLMSLSAQGSEKKIPHSVKEESILLTGEVLDFPVKADYDRLLFLYRDKHLVEISFVDTPSGHFVNIYRNRGSKPVYSAMPSKKAAEVYNSPYLCKINSDTLTVIDEKGKCITIDLPSALKSRSYEGKIGMTSLTANGLLPYKDKILYLSPTWIDSDYLTPEEKGEKFLLTDESYQSKEISGKYYNFMVLGGDFISDHSKKRLLFFNSRIDKIEVYDYELNLLDEITGPDEIIHEEYIFPDTEKSNNRMIGLKDADYKETYLPLTICSSDKYVFAAYSGNEVGNETEGSLIFQFDWNGNLIDHYRTEEKIITLSAFTDGSAVAAMTMSKEGVFRFLKYRFKE